MGRHHKRRQRMRVRRLQEEARLLHASLHDYVPCDTDCHRAHVSLVKAWEDGRGYGIDIIDPHTINEVIEVLVHFYIFGYTINDG
jgi:hypothetical protein